MANPLNPKQLLLGSFDGNCPGQAALGFHLSSNGGSTWNHSCMPYIYTKNWVLVPVDEPLVGRDRKGAACIAGDCDDSEARGKGFVAFSEINRRNPLEQASRGLVSPSQRTGPTFPPLGILTGTAFDRTGHSIKLRACGCPS